jgi:hypothetical protein
MMVSAIGYKHLVADRGFVFGNDHLLAQLASA